MDQNQNSTISAGPWVAGKAAPVEKSAWLGSVWRQSGSTVKTIFAVELLRLAISMDLQAVEETRLAEPISAMRAEQGWLVGQGLADQRRIGSHPIGPDSGLLASLLTHNGRLRGKTTQFGSQASLPGGWDAPTNVLILDSLWTHAGRDSFLDREPAIFAGPKRLGAFEGDLAMVYRHEEGHAQARSHGMGLGIPDAWPREAGVILSEAARTDSSSESQKAKSADWTPQAGVLMAGAANDSSSPNWRANFLRGTWSEAFADAYACLGAARHGPGALRACALSTHGQRALPDMLGDSVTSTYAAGSDHAVEMASFIAGQLDERAVAALDRGPLLELAGKIADASTAWALARQAPALNFFSAEGRQWWLSLPRGSEIDSKRAEELWGQLADSALAPAPKAAFGPFRAVVAGIAFSAIGLPQSLAANWRYDGAEGRHLLKGVGDSADDEAEAASRRAGAAVARPALPTQEPAPPPGLDPQKARLLAIQARIASIEAAETFDQERSFDAAAGAQMALARLIGLPSADLAAEEARLRSLREAFLPAPAPDKTSTQSGFASKLYERRGGSASPEEATPSSSGPRY